MTIHNTLTALTTAITLTAAAAAAVAPANAGVMHAPANPNERQPSGDLATAPEGTIEVPVIDETALYDLIVRGIDEDSLVLEFRTTSGCTFDVEFASEGDVEVLGGNNYRCDWDSWLDANTVLAEVSQVVSLWESQAWWEFFYAMIEGDDDDTSPIPDPGAFVEVEQDDDSCAGALADAALSNLACGGSIVVGIASIGTGIGAVGGGILAVAACGFYAKSVATAVSECADARNIIGFTVEDLLDIEYLVSEDVLVEFLDPEELAQTFVDVEQWMSDTSDPANCQAVVATCIDVYSQVEAAMVP